MLDVDVASTTEVQIERDNCRTSVLLLEQSYRDGLITTQELFDRGAPLNRQHKRCLTRLNKDFIEAIKIAGQWRDKYDD